MYHQVLSELGIMQDYRRNLCVFPSIMLKVKIHLTIDIDQ